MEVEVIDIFKNPVMIGLLFGFCTYLYMQNENNNKSDKNKKNINMTIPLMIIVIGWFVSDMYINNGIKYSQTQQSVQHTHDPTIPLMQSMAPLKSKYEFKNNAHTSDISEPLSFNLIKNNASINTSLQKENIFSGIHIPSQLPSIMLDMY